MSGVKIFVINLKRSKDRRILIKKELDRLGMPFSFINAIDGKLIKPSYQKKMSKLRFEAYKKIENLKAKNNVSRGVVGCSLSHIKIYSHIVKKKIPLALVLEDDSEINEDLKKAVEDPLLLELAREGVFEVLNLGCVKREGIYMPILRFFGRRKIHNNQTIGRPARIIPGTSCYLLTLSGAKKLLEASLPLRYGADQLLSNAEYFDITLLATRIPIVVQKRFLKSTIETGTKKKAVRNRKSLYKKIVGFPQKIIKLLKLDLFASQLSLRQYYDESFLAVEKLSKKKITYTK
jgi:glycosyl transferase family 25